MSDTEDKREGSKKQYGAPPPTGLEARKNSGKLCTATRRNGTPCANFALLGAPVCRVHGGTLPSVRRAAQVRLLQSADLLMAELLKIAMNPKLPVQHRLVAIRDGLDRANLSGTQNVEVTVEKGKTFEDFVGEALIDVEEDDPNVVDADIVYESDDYTLPVPRAAFDPETMSRHDRAALGEALRNRDPRPSKGMSREERQRREAEALATIPRSTRSMADPTIARAAYVAALESGATTEEAEAAGRATAEGATGHGNRRARTSEATMTTGSGARRRRK